MGQKLRNIKKSTQDKNISNQDFLSAEDIIDQYLLFGLFKEEKEKANLNK